VTALLWTHRPRKISKRDADMIGDLVDDVLHRLLHGTIRGAALGGWIQVDAGLWLAVAPRGDA